MSYLSQLAEKVAQCRFAELDSLGVVSSPGRRSLALAANCARNEWQLYAASQPEQYMGRRLQLPGSVNGQRLTSPCARCVG
ncbi:DNA methylation and regulatory protein [Erwinia pyrifoliae DSM 12163]|nr:DNA methylation and regulatory protein [Erwinia pyrifoliae DSM 12163]